ncbi:MAG TPA: FHA domain-containing protein [Actinomycetaceae bacterium]|nr:FHA domain-containing protein [Actinomycetaceae bacterium]
MSEGRLVPRAARPYLRVEVALDAHHEALAPLRREALDVLAAGYRSTGRTLLGLLSWAVVVTGAGALAALPWLTTGTPQRVLVAGAGTVLLAAGLWLAAGVLRAGRRITGAAAGWLRVPAAGASDADASVLLAVVRWRAVLAAVAAATAVALAVTLAYVLAQTGALGTARLGGTTPPAVTDGGGGALLVATLAVAVVATAGAAAATSGGVRTVAEAAWQRPTVAAAVPTGTGVPPAPAPRPATAEGPATTVLDLSVLHTRDAPAQLSVPAPAGSGVEVVLPDGRTLRQGTTLLGRRPVPRPGDVVDDVVVLTDQTVTKTHASVTVDGDTVRVVDRASTNGTLLEAPDGSLSRCRPWQVTTVRGPAIIHLGRTRLLVRPAVTRRPLEVA